MYRKISKYIKEYLTGSKEKILCIDDARQGGKLYIVRESIYLKNGHFIF